LAAVAAEYGVPIILMHMLGTPKTMQLSPVYEDLISEIRAFLADAIQRALGYGISKNNIIIDPGIGFGKTVAHNLRIIKHLHEFETLDAPILIGPSRKSFIRKILKDPDTDDIDPNSPIVETGTQATLCAAVMNGAHIIRVHDVAGTCATLRIVDAIKNA
jgi:dihydropteroate synthase